jgi:microcystin-dependent protein
MHEAPMSQPFLAEIRMMSFVFPPRGWALCNGQLLPINQNQALFSLLGTRFGGNGQTTFALPNLQGRVPMHVGRGHPLGEVAGEQAHILSMGEMTQHTHVFNPSSVAATTNTPTSSLGLAASAGSFLYGPPANLVTMNSLAVSFVGGNQAHENMQPYLTISFCIALQGVFPSQN